MKKAGAILWILLAAFAASALEYWVAPGGDDRADGSRENPWKTLAHANERMRPGDLLWLAPGDYPGSIAPQSGGTPEEPVAYCAVSSGKVRILPAPGRSAVELHGRDFIILDGLTLCGSADTAWLDLQNSRGILLINLTMTGSPGTNPGTLQQCEHLIFRRCDADAGGSEGVFHFRQCRSLTLEESDFRNFHSPVMHFDNLRSGRIRKNSFAARTKNGVFAISGNAPELTLTGNLFWETHPARQTASGSFLYRNVFFAPSDPALLPDGFWHCTVISGDPAVKKILHGVRNNWTGSMEEGKFRNPSAGDFRLTLQSPALDQGKWTDRIAAAENPEELLLEPEGLIASHRRHFRNAICRTEQTLQILQIAFRHGEISRSIRLESSKTSCRKGEGIALPWHGAAPDAGAYEYSMLTSDQPPVLRQSRAERREMRDRDPEFHLENPFRHWRR